MTMISTWSCRFGAAVLGAVLSFAVPSFAGDGCCGEAKEEEKVVAAATPQECFTAVACAMHAGNKEALWSQLSTKSQELAAKKGEECKDGVSKCEETQKMLGVTAAQVKEMSGKDLMVAILMAKAKAAMAKAKDGGCCPEEKTEGAADEKKADPMALKDLKIDGDKATATCPLGMPLAFVKEKDAWKMDITAMLEKGCDDGGKCEEKPKE